MDTKQSNGHMKSVAGLGVNYFTEPDLRQPLEILLIGFVSQCVHRIVALCAHTHRHAVMCVCLCVSMCMYLGTAQRGIKFD